MILSADLNPFQAWLTHPSSSVIKLFPLGKLGSPPRSDIWCQWKVKLFETVRARRLTWVYSSFLLMMVLWLDHLENMICSHLWTLMFKPFALRYVHQEISPVSFWLVSHILTVTCCTRSAIISQYCLHKLDNITILPHWVGWNIHQEKLINSSHSFLQHHTETYNC